MNKKKKALYNEEFKRSSAQLAVESEQPTRAVARELGLNPTTLYGWVNKY